MNVKTVEENHSDPHTYITKRWLLFETGTKIFDHEGLAKNYERIWLELALKINGKIQIQTRQTRTRTFMQSNQLVVTFSELNSKCESHTKVYINHKKKKRNEKKTINIQTNFIGYLVLLTDFNQIIAKFASIFNFYFINLFNYLFIDTMHSFLYVFPLFWLVRSIL